MHVSYGPQHGHSALGRPPPHGRPEIWSGSQISTSISSLIPVQLDEDDCPLQTQPFPEATLILKKLTPLWDHGINDWSQLLGPAPNGRPYFLDERELEWANPSTNFSLPKKLAHDLKYTRTLLSSKSPEEWRLLNPRISGPAAIDLSIAPR
jgi:hypothetical protein